MLEPPVYRAPMRWRVPAVPVGAAVERALAEGVVGMGGALDPAPRTVVEAAALAAAQHDERLAARIERFAEAPEGAFVWTRDDDGLSWLGRLAGEWRYDASPDASAVDLVHVRPCAWLGEPVADADVPPAVRSTFARGGRNWQRTHDPAVSRLSAELWERGARPKR
ncbi:GAF domain-containing protein [Agrococcus sp. TF02-05]|uniref:GAF domain-containing protein n=1 Tax=Agrococcus sp. TF02-05 TaxID=2815211 RepID=UPI001AA0DD15|nr:GAF domain-containing protein [Agrococcus sp. TF02-05]MBO1769911.1 GAF domain-containing protein [Agrococcus sp. TF02-05]